MKKLRSVALTAFALMSAGGASAAVNLVENGDFDADTPAPSFWPLDWTLFRLDPNFIVGDEIGYVSGPNAANFGVSTFSVLESLSQNIKTIPGKEYTLSFDLAESGGDGKNFFGIILARGGPSLFLFDSPAFGFREYSLTFTAATSVTPISFSGADNGGWFALDNVSVVAAPEPVGWTLMLVGFAGLGAALRFRLGLIR
jgi:hypothetical protein